MTPQLPNLTTDSPTVCRIKSAKIQDAIAAFKTDFGLLPATTQRVYLQRFNDLIHDLEQDRNLLTLMAQEQSNPKAPTTSHPA